MRIGVNWISPTSLRIIQALIREGWVSCCEMMVDNFAHLPTDKIKAALLDVPIVLHIVASRFLEKSPSELQTLAMHLKPWIRELQPQYVSDHLVQFTNASGQWLPMITELHYDRDRAHIYQRVNEWQALLDTKLYFENHASLTVAGQDQAVFFADLMRESSCGLLFDFSNAYIAERNQVCAFKTWESLLKQTDYFHVGGFRVDKTSQLLLDTHDQPIAEDVLSLIKEYLPDKNNPLLIIECDARASYDNWCVDINRVRNH